MNLQEQTASPITIRIGGNELRLSSLRLSDHAEAAARLQQSWRAPAEAARVAAGLPESLQRYVLQLAYEDERRGNEPTLEDVFRWYETPAGQLFRYWLMLRREQPELSFDDVDRLLVQLEEAEVSPLQKAADTADGLPSGNGPSPLPATATGTKTGTGARQTTSPGGRSSSNSATAKAGRRAKSPS